MYTASRNETPSDSFRPEPVYGQSDYRAFHATLINFNSMRLAPALPGEDSARLPITPNAEQCIADERVFLDTERRAVCEAAAQAPTDHDGFLLWFEGLAEVGPGQGDPLFPWLADRATLEEMKWFLTQEAAGEAGFDDLVALTQVRFPTRAKLEMARNYWDEMGRGNEAGMHGPMLEKAVEVLGLEPATETTVWESLALANLMVAMAANRDHAYHAVGALGVIEMTAPGRVACVNRGLRRLGVPTAARMYFQLHEGLDVEHSKSWNREIIGPLAASDPQIAGAIAEGALMRLAAGARCFHRYRQHFEHTGH